MVKKWHRFVERGFSGLLWVMMSLLFIQTPAASAASITIGGNYELSGEAAAYGQAMVEGLELAVEEINAQGGLVDGQEVEFVVYDNQSDVTESASVAQRLVSEGVNGIVGPALTGTAQAQIPIITEAGIVNVLPAATGDGLTLDNDGNVLDYLFRVCFENAFQGRLGAKFSRENLGAETAVILVDNGADYSRGLADNFKDEFTSRGGSVVSEQAFSTGDTDFSAILSSLMAMDFDVIYLPAYYTEAGMIIKQAREMGIEAPIVGADGFSSEVLVELSGPEAASSIYYTDHFSPDSDEPVVVEFMEAFSSKFDKQASTFNALGYDAAVLIFDAIERAGSTDPQAIQEAIVATEAFEGVTGTFAMDEFHNPVKSAVMIQLEAGEIASTETIGLD